MLSEWLLQNAGPIIRYKTQVELLNTTDYEDLSNNMRELLSLPQVQKRLSLLKHLDYFRIHGSDNTHLENVLPMLNDYGLNYDINIFKETIENSQISNIITEYTYDQKIEAYPFFIQSNFPFEELLDFVIERINIIYDFTRHMDFDIYDDKEKFKSVPKTFQNRPIIKPELVNEGRYKYPLIYDIVAFAGVYDCVDTNIKEKIDNIIAYIISPEYDKIVFGYGIIAASQRRYYSMGWDCKKPFNGNLNYEYPNLHRLLLYSNFPIVLKSMWFQNAIDYLEQYKTINGTYIFPDGYIIEKDSNWVLGSHMSLAENRRKSRYLEIESTFYMLKLLSRSIGVFF